MRGGAGATEGQCEHQALCRWSSDLIRRRAQVAVAQRGITARKVVAQLLGVLRRAGAVLQGVLPPAAHVAAASALLQATLSAIIGG